MNIYPLNFDFLQPYCEEGDVRFVGGFDGYKADFFLTMNQSGHTAEVNVAGAKNLAAEYGKPLAYWTIEDPNSYQFTLPQARLADYVFTSDGALINQYRADLGHDRVWWLPLAASEKYHHPLPLAEDATDFVFSGNWYRNEARQWGEETVILPLARAGYSMTIFSYAAPGSDGKEPDPNMPEELRPFWRGATSCRTVAEQYTHGRVVLGNNNQVSGKDGRQRTLMCSMRVFEALACGKPFLSPWSAAYEALGLLPGECPSRIIGEAWSYPYVFSS